MKKYHLRERVNTSKSKSLLDLISVGIEFQNFSAEMRTVIPPSVSWLYLGHRTAMSPKRDVRVDTSLAASHSPYT